MHVRPSKRWRLLAMALIPWATLAWPAAAHGVGTWHIELMRQAPVAALGTDDEAPLALAVRVGGTNGDDRAAHVAIYPRVTTRSALAPIIDGTGLSTAALSDTGAFPLNCRSGGVASFTLTLGGGSGTAAPTCGGAEPYLRLHCANTACAGVYPLAITVSRGADTDTLWSLVSVTSGTTRFVQTSWIFTSNPVSENAALHEATALHALALWPSARFSLAPSYESVDQVAHDTTGPYAQLRQAIGAALSGNRHQLVNQPAASVDLATPATHGLLSNVAGQAHFASHLIGATLHHGVAPQVVLGGVVTPNDLIALRAVGVRRVILPDESLQYPPSNSLSWGTPFYVDTVPSSVVAAATDTPLRELTIGSSTSAVLRATLALGTLALLHYEAPYASSQRTVVVDAPLVTLSPRFVQTFFGGARRDPLVHVVGLGAALRVDQVGANGYPSVRSLATGEPGRWSSINITTTKSLTAHLGSFSTSVTSLRPTTPVFSQLLLSQRRVGPSERQRELSLAVAELRGQFAKLRIDTTPITLTGSGAELPITVTSKASYGFHGWVRFSAPDVSFPDGNTVAFSISTVAQSVRVRAVVHGSGNFTLDARLLTSDRAVIVDSAAIQVRSAANSIVGYVLTVGSLGVIALWWLRTNRRRTRGTHAP